MTRLRNMEETAEVKGRDPGHPGPAMAKHGNDCYYYYNSSCTAGDACKFRHCEAALGSDMVCFLWKKGRCARPDCKFRHMHIPKKKKERPCYWESKPQGCQNPQCAFSHKRPRNADAIFAASDKSVKSGLGASRKRGMKRKDLGDGVNHEVFFIPHQKVFKSVKDRLTWPADAIAFSQSAADTSASLAITTPKTPYGGRRVMHIRGFSRRKKMWRHEKQNAGYWGLHKGETPIEEGHIAPEESPPFGAELHPTADDTASHQSCCPPHCLDAMGFPPSDYLRETAASPSTSSTSAEERYEDLLTEFAGYVQDDDMDDLEEKPLTDLIEELVDYANQC